MADTQSALWHVEAAIKAMTLESYRESDTGWVLDQGHTIAEELDRIDRAIGPKGESTFARFADTIREVFTELYLAKLALKEA